MSDTINIHFVDTDEEASLGPPFTLENIADLAQMAIRIPSEEFMDRCRIFYVNDQENEARIYRSQDLQMIVAKSYSILDVFVQKIDSPDEPPLPEPESTESKSMCINFVDTESCTTSGPPFTIENIAGIASIVIKVPPEEFTNRCKIYCKNSDGNDVHIFRSQDLQWMIDTSSGSLDIFVQLNKQAEPPAVEEEKETPQESGTDPNEIRVHLVDLDLVKVLSTPCNAQQVVDLAASLLHIPSNELMDVCQAQMTDDSMEHPYDFKSIQELQWIISSRRGSLDIYFWRKTDLQQSAQAEINDQPKMEQKEIETFQAPPLLFKAVGKEIRSYNCQTRMFKLFQSSDLPHYSNDERLVFISPEILFISGGYNHYSRTLNQCFELNITHTKFSTKAPMIQGRYSHGIIKFNSFIYVFGGFNNKENLAASEIYSIQANSWHHVTSLPVADGPITCALVYDKIFITGCNFSLISFTPDTEVYHIFQLELAVGPKLIAKVQQRLYLILGNETYELNNEGQLLNTISRNMSTEYKSQYYIANDREINYIVGDGNIYQMDLEQNDSPTLQVNLKTMRRQFINPINLPYPPQEPARLRQSLPRQGSPQQPIAGSQAPNFAATQPIPQQVRAQQNFGYETEIISHIQSDYGQRDQSAFQRQVQHLPQPHQLQQHLPQAPNIPNRPDNTPMPQLAGSPSVGNLRTQQVGHPNPNSYVFDDTNYVESSTRIVQVTGWFNQSWVGIEVVYETNGQRRSIRHVGCESEEAVNITLHLDPEEHITRVSGRCSDIIDRLTLTTSKNKAMNLGGEGGYPFDLKIPAGHRVASFFGGFERLLDNIGANYVEIRPSVPHPNSARNISQNSSEINSNIRNDFSSSCANPQIAALVDNSQQPIRPPAAFAQTMAVVQRITVFATFKRNKMQFEIATDQRISQLRQQIAQEMKIPADQLILK